MQDRYAGDIGDYVKLALIRYLSRDRRMGVNWYMYKDEDHNADGRYISYLNEPDRWRSLDCELFDHLVHQMPARSVDGLKGAIGKNGKFFDIPAPTGGPVSQRSLARERWFNDCLGCLSSCDLIFADPDNGIVDDEHWRRSSPKFAKQIPLSEVRALSDGRSSIIYHHNSRFKGGHDAEVDHWLRALGIPTLAVRATAYSCRTFFIVNPDAEIVERTQEFCKRWANHKVRLHRSPIM